jgi:hypothetical protein
VVLQVALAVALLLGAGLLVRSLWSLSRTNLGFDPHNLFLASVYVPDESADFASTSGRYRELAAAALGATWLPARRRLGSIPRPPSKASDPRARVPSREPRAGRLVR